MLILIKYSNAPLHNTPNLSNLLHKAVFTQAKIFIKMSTITKMCVASPKVAKAGTILFCHDWWFLKISLPM